MQRQSAVVATIVMAATMILSLPGCRHQTEQPQPGTPTAENEAAWWPLEVVTMREWGEMHSLPIWEEFHDYWRDRAAEQDPIDAAYAIVAGTVTRVEVVGERATGDRSQPDPVTHIEFDVVCPIKGPIKQGRTLCLDSYVPVFSIVDRDFPGVLAPGRAYLLFLGRPEPNGAFTYDPLALPTAVPLDKIDAAACVGRTPAARITRVLAASLDAPDPDARAYAFPVLGYLAHSHPEANADTALLNLLRSGDADEVSSALWWLTRWDDTHPGILSIAEARSSDEDPRVASFALAVRIEANGSAELLEEVVAWAMRPDASTGAGTHLFIALRDTPPATMSEEVLAAYEELLSPEVPGGLRQAVVDVLVQTRGRDAQSLLVKAMHDPSPTIAHKALRGLFEAARTVGDLELREQLPDREEFERAPEEYIEYWTEWWEEKRNPSRPLPVHLDDDLQDELLLPPVGF